METLYNINISVSPIMLELAARLIHEGVAQTILEKHRAYAKQQNALVDQYLGDYQILGMRNVFLGGSNCLTSLQVFNLNC